MTLMSRKGILSHDRQGRAYLYRPMVSRRQVLDAVLEELVAEFFHGSREELLRFVVGDGAQAPLSRPRQKRARPPLPGAVPAAVPSPVSAAAEAEEDVILL
jgi:hypothetical protein